MDFNSDKEDAEVLSKSKLYLLRKKKIKNEIEAAKRLLNKNVEPLKVADKFMHNIFELIKDGVSNRYPSLSEEEVSQKIRDTLALTRKIKANRKRGRNIG